MRYYKIVIGDNLQTYTSLAADGSTAQGALDIELDIPLAPYNTPVGGSFVRIYGIPLQQIAQSADLNNKSISVYGGMAKGLPLANPAQAGLLAKGTIFPAYGNWIGTDQTLDLILAPPLGSNAAPANIVHDWQKGTPLSQAIANTIKTAFPTFKANININSNITLPQNDAGFYRSIEQYAAYIFGVSKRVIGGSTYAGVRIVASGDTINVFDGSAQSGSPKAIAFQDMIGQPTWIGLNTISFKTVMRADISIGQQITLPQVQATTTAQSAAQFRSKSAFQGTFMVNAMRPVGRYRQPDAASWVTVFEAVTGAGQGIG